MIDKILKANNKADSLNKKLLIIKTHIGINKPNKWEKNSAYRDIKRQYDFWMNQWKTLMSDESNRKEWHDYLDLMHGRTEEWKKMNNA